MSIKSRVQKLEGAGGIEMPTIFLTFVNTDGERIERASALTPAGKIERADGETEGEFLKRVYASRCPKKPIEHFTEREVDYLAASQDEEAALAMARTGNLPDEVLNNVINRLKETADELRKEEQ
ncbi:hypothetical protein [uncultured Roseovarius sp.]|uniref:hypothetical protein n=1 Tax=uncultured Roseovarius sp. TaxID=293344 RepID=UPI0026168B7F|nr:hypothetical protein [uncultured Roseovarius sp.]